MTNTVCLIGGGGFVGSALRHALRAHGRAVVIIGRSPTLVCSPNEIYLSRAVHDIDAIGARLAAYETKEIVDLAYASAPNARTINLLGDLTTSVAGIIDHLDLAIRLKVKTYLFVSSGGTIYGDIGRAAFVEDQAVEPISSYGIAKLACERVVHLYHRTRDLPSIVVRPSNIYGPGQMPFTGQGMVATALGSGALGRTVTVFGDGEGIRDYLFTEDCATGLLTLLDKGQYGQTYNLGSGNGVTTNKLLATIKRALARDGYGFTTCHVVSDTAAIHYNVLDRTKIGIDTGWVPKISLPDGIERTWSWLKTTIYPP